MKKNLFLILAASLITIALTGCYTMLYTSQENLSSDNTDNTVIIYYPVPIIDPVPYCPRPLRPTKTPPTKPGNIRDRNPSKVLIRNNNGGRGDESRNASRTPSRVRRESTNTGANNSKPRAVNTNNNTDRNNGSRSTGRGR